MARVSAVLAGLASSLDCARLPTFFVPLQEAFTQALDIANLLV